MKADILFTTKKRGIKSGLSLFLNIPTLYFAQENLGYSDNDGYADYFENEKFAELINQKQWLDFYYYLSVYKNKNENLFHIITHVLNYDDCDTNYVLDKVKLIFNSPVREYPIIFLNDKYFKLETPDKLKKSIDFWLFLMKEKELIKKEKYIEELSWKIKKLSKLFILYDLPIEELNNYETSTLKKLFNSKNNLYFSIFFLSYFKHLKIYNQDILKKIQEVLSYLKKEEDIKHTLQLLHILFKEFKEKDIYFYDLLLPLLHKIEKVTLFSLIKSIKENKNAQFLDKLEYLIKHQYNEYFLRETNYFLESIKENILDKEDYDIIINISQKNTKEKRSCLELYKIIKIFTELKQKKLTYKIPVFQQILTSSLDYNNKLILSILYFNNKISHKEVLESIKTNTTKYKTIEEIINTYITFPDFIEELKKYRSYTHVFEINSTIIRLLRKFIEIEEIQKIIDYFIKSKKNEYLDNNKGLAKMLNHLLYLTPYIKHYGDFLFNFNIIQLNDLYHALGGELDIDDIIFLFNNNIKEMSHLVLISKELRYYKFDDKKFILNNIIKFYNPQYSKNHIHAIVKYMKIKYIDKYPLDDGDFMYILENSRESDVGNAFNLWFFGLNKEEAIRNSKTIGGTISAAEEYLTTKIPHYKKIKYDIRKKVIEPELLWYPAYVWEKILKDENIKKSDIKLPNNYLDFIDNYDSSKKEEQSATTIIKTIIENEYLLEEKKDIEKFLSII